MYSNNLTCRVAFCEVGHSEQKGEFLLPQGSYCLITLKVHGVNYNNVAGIIVLFNMS